MNIEEKEDKSAYNCGNFHQIISMCFFHLFTVSLSYGPYGKWPLEFWERKSLLGICCWLDGSVTAVIKHGIFFGKQFNLSPEVSPMGS